MRSDIQASEDRQLSDFFRLDATNIRGHTFQRMKEMIYYYTKDQYQIVNINTVSFVYVLKYYEIPYRRIICGQQLFCRPVSTFSDGAYPYQQKCPIPGQYTEQIYLQIVKINQVDNRAMGTKIKFHKDLLEYLSNKF